MNLLDDSPNLDMPTPDDGMKIYISGPMAGQKNLNRHAFYDAAGMLRDDGWIVINPHEFLQNLEANEEDAVSAHDRAVYLRKDLHELSDCDAVYMLDGWHLSTGATIEMIVALVLDLTVIFQTVGEYDLDWSLFNTHLRDVIAGSGVPK